MGAEATPDEEAVEDGAGGANRQDPDDAARGGDSRDARRETPGELFARTRSIPTPQRTPEVAASRWSWGFIYGAMHVLMVALADGLGVVVGSGSTMRILLGGWALIALAPLLLRGFGVGKGVARSPWFLGVAALELGGFLLVFLTPLGSLLHLAGAAVLLVLAVLTLRRAMAEAVPAPSRRELTSSRVFGAILIAPVVALQVAAVIVR